ncbi:MAG: hypothetical protein OXC44_05660 [Proteobacteria bacterium]|nr:hypothetical protein [Pseudomonadota bacterium]
MAFNRYLWSFIQVVIFSVFLGSLYSCHKGARPYGGSQVNSSLGNSDASFANQASQNVNVVWIVEHYFPEGYSGKTGGFFARCPNWPLVPCQKSSLPPATVYPQNSYSAFYKGVLDLVSEAPSELNLNMTMVVRSSRLKDREYSGPYMQQDIQAKLEAAGITVIQGRYAFNKATSDFCFPVFGGYPYNHKGQWFIKDRANDFSQNIFEIAGFKPGETNIYAMVGPKIDVPKTSPSMTKGEFFFEELQAYSNDQGWDQLDATLYAFTQENTIVGRNKDNCTNVSHYNMITKRGGASYGVIDDLEQVKALSKVKNLTREMDWDGAFNDFKKRLDIDDISNLAKNVTY